MNNSSAVVAAVCRWTGRIAGAVLVVLTVSIAIGEGMPNPFTQPGGIQVGFLTLALLLIGILAGWKWELAGGILSLLGWGSFVLAVIPSARRLTGFVLLLALPGILYVTSALLRRWQPKHPSTC